MTTAAGPELVPVGDTTLIGTVVEFDDARGVGTVGCGDRSVPFHCTAVTDGSRRIEVGTVVAVRIRAARLGRIEARSVRPLPGVPNAVPGGSGDVDRPGAHSPRPIDDRTYGPVGPPAVVPSPSPPVAASEPVVEPAVGGDVEGGGSAPSWPADESPTPAVGTPAVPSGTGGPAPAAPSVTRPAAEGVDGADDDDESAPRPDFWSPFSRSPAGPPPTWSTPVTPKEPPTDPS